MYEIFNAVNSSTILRTDLHTGSRVSGVLPRSPVVWAFYWDRFPVAWIYSGGASQEQLVAIALDTLEPQPAYDIRWPPEYGVGALFQAAALHDTVYALTADLNYVFEASFNSSTNAMRLEWYNLNLSAVLNWTASPVFFVADKAVNRLYLGYQSSGLLKLLLFTPSSTQPLLSHLPLPYPFLVPAAAAVSGSFLYISTSVKGDPEGAFKEDFIGVLKIDLSTPNISLTLSHSLSIANAYTGNPTQMLVVKSFVASSQYLFLNLQTPAGDYVGCPLGHPYAYNCSDVLLASPTASCAANRSVDAQCRQTGVAIFYTENMTLSQLYLGPPAEPFGVGSWYDAATNYLYTPTHSSLVRIRNHWLPSWRVIIISPDESSSVEGGSPVGLAVGVVVVVLAIALLAGLAWFCWRRKKTGPKYVELFPTEAALAAPSSEEEQA